MLTTTQLTQVNTILCVVQAISITQSIPKYLKFQLTFMISVDIMALHATLLQVMKEGQVQEFDSPYTLLQSPKSLFKKMVEQTGQCSSQKLHTMAAEAHRSRLTMDNEACNTHMVSPL